MKKLLPAHLLSFLMVIMVLFGHKTSGQELSGYSQSSIDSLENALTEKAKGTERYELLTMLTEAWLDSVPEKAVEYGEESLKVAGQYDIEPSYKLYLALATAHEKTKRYIPAIEKMLVAKSLISKEQNPKELSAACNYLGHLYSRMGEYMLSIENYEEAISTGTQYGLVEELARAYYGLAIVYGSLGKTMDQIDSYKKFLEVADPEKDHKKISMALMMWASLLRDQGQYDEAIDLLNRSFEQASASNDSIFMALVMNHIAWTYYEAGELQTSLEYYQKNLDISIPINRKQNITNVYGNMGNIYRDLRDYDKALEYYSKSLDISREIGDIYNLSWLHEDMAKMYANLGDYEKAYEYSRNFAQYNDSLMNMRYESELAQARARYEAEKSQKELEIVSLKLRNNRIIIFGLLGAFLISVALAILLIQRNRYRSNQRLEAMKHKISELNQQNLRQQINPHFIFNTLNSIQYYVFQHDKISANNYMSKFATLMRKTLENSQQTAIPIKDELDALELYLDLEKIRFKDRFEWHIEVEDEIDTLTYKIPTMLIQPYVENALSHGLMHKEGKGYVKITLNQVNGSISCVVEDNGIGRQKAGEIKERKNGNHNSLGTKITESRLKLVNELYGNKMQVKYGDLTDPNGNPAGTRVQITVPIIT